VGIRQKGDGVYKVAHTGGMCWFMLHGVVVRRVVMCAGWYAMARVSWLVCKGCGALGRGRGVRGVVRTGGMRRAVQGSWEGAMLRKNQMDHLGLLAAPRVIPMQAPRPCYRPGCVQPLRRLGGTPPRAQLSFKSCSARATYTAVATNSSRLSANASCVSCMRHVPRTLESPRGIA
jgi:hypothetical protein